MLTAPAPSFLLKCAPPLECGGAPLPPPPPEGEEAVRPSREDGVPAVSIRQHTSPQPLRGPRMPNLLY
jgi:hypothetical protein